MNRRVRTSIFRRSGVKAGVRALPDHRAPNIRGGMGHKSAGGCSTAIFLTLLYHRRLPATTRPDRADTGEKGRTEATPPFLPLVRQSGLGFGAGGVTWFGAHPAPPLMGVASVQIIPAGRLPTSHPLVRGILRSGPRRQGSASRFAPCDCCGPIQQRADTRGCFFRFAFHSDNQFGSMA